MTLEEERRIMDDTIKMLISSIKEEIKEVKETANRAFNDIADHEREGNKTHLDLTKQINDLDTKVLENKSETKLSMMQIVTKLENNERSMEGLHKEVRWLRWFLIISIPVIIGWISIEEYIKLLFKGIFP